MNFTKQSMRSDVKAYFSDDVEDLQDGLVHDFKLDGEHPIYIMAVNGDEHDVYFVSTKPFQEKDVKDVIDQHLEPNESEEDEESLESK